TGERARLALERYVRRTVREIGALAAVLGGLDLLVAAARVREQSAFVREPVGRDLAFHRLRPEPGAAAGAAPIISSDASRVRVGVEPTNEEWVAARDALRALG